MTTARIEEELVGKTVGLVAGRGDYPLEFCRAARAGGVARIAVVAVHGETDAEIEGLADSTDWVHVGQLRKTIKSLKARGAGATVFAGQIKPSRLFLGMRPDLKALKLLWRLRGRDRHAHSIFAAIADEFESCGVRVLPAVTFMGSSLAKTGVLGNISPSRRDWSDIELGARIAREVSRLDIGQTVVVKKGTVLAVEGFEGSDKAIRRGGELGHGRVTVVKVSKPGHDLRFDVPCVGERTIQILHEARAAALAVEAGGALLIKPQAVIEACDQFGIALVGIELAAEPD